MSTPEEVVHQYWDQQPHPMAPTLTIGEYPVAARLATVLKFGKGYANPQEVANFWSEFQGMNDKLQAQGKMPYSPEEFMQTAKDMAKSSYAYHGRPPTMSELTSLKDAHPKDVRSYYAELPDKTYPTVPAGQMAAMLHAARPHAQMNLGRAPNKLEAAHLYHSGTSPSEYYKALKAEQDASRDQSGGHAGVPGQDDAGGQQAGPRTDGAGVAERDALAGGGQGVPA